MFNLGLNHGAKHQMSTTLSSGGEQLCVVDCSHASHVAPWVRSRNSALLAPFKDDTFFERCPLVAPATRKDVTPLNLKPGGLMEQSNASLQRGDQG